MSSLSFTRLDVVAYGTSSQLCSSCRLCWCKSSLSNCGLLSEHVQADSRAATVLRLQASVQILQSLRLKVIRRHNSVSTSRLSTCWHCNEQVLRQGLFAGPTFRAEQSNTSRHLAEFWMIEPEMAFADLKRDIAAAEAYLKHCLQYILENCQEDLSFFQKQYNADLIERLQVCCFVYCRLNHLA